MPRYIDADVVVKRLDEIQPFAGNKAANAAINLCKDIVRNAPTVSPDEARGVGKITDDDACPVCGCWIPTDDAHDAIFKNEVKFCYYCGTRLRMKGADDGTTDNS